MKIQKLNKKPFDVLKAEEVNKLSSDIKNAFDYAVVSRTDLQATMNLYFYVFNQREEEIITFDTQMPFEFEGEKFNVFFETELVSGKDFEIYEAKLFADQVYLKSVRIKFNEYEKATRACFSLESNELSVGNISFKIMMNSKGSLIRFNKVMWGW